MPGAGRGGGQPAHHLVHQQQGFGPRQRIGRLVQHPQNAHQQVHHLGKFQRQRVGRNNGVAPLFQELGNDFTGVARAAQHRNVGQLVAVAQGLLHQLQGEVAGAFVVAQQRIGGVAGEGLGGVSAGGGVVVQGRGVFLGEEQLDVRRSPHPQPLSEREEELVSESLDVPSPLERGPGG